MSNDTTIEQDIQAKGLTAPRVTLADVEACIAREFYCNPLNGQGMGAALAIASGDKTVEAMSTITICVMVLKNGHKIVGVNEGPVSPANFDAEIGRKIARQKAIDQIWPLLGYELRTELSRRVLTEADAAADLAGTPRPAAA